MRFWKLDGAGNDFVLVEPSSASPKALARRLCDRRRGVGADGLLVVDKKRRSFSYYNADGSAAFCGNGARCVAVWLSGGKKSTLAYEGPSGPLLARVFSAERAAVAMPDPVLLQGSFPLKAAGQTFRVQWWETGVPHAVVTVRGLVRLDVARAGREIRFHKVFGRPGANVDFIELKGRAVHVRTYERGVEAETLACGTGAMAAAFAAGPLPRVVVPTSGQPLKVYAAAKRVWLEGPARVVFQGEIS